MGLPSAGQAKGQYVDAAFHEAAAGQFARLLLERQGRPVVLEGLPGLARGQPALPAQPADAPVPTVLGFLFQHFQEGIQGIAVSGGGEAGHRLRAHGRQPELAAQLSDPVLHSYGVRHEATPASRLS